MEYTVSQLARLSGVSRRTLRYYDQEGLLPPAGVTEAGYRIYGAEQVERLQQILFYRELGLALKDIRRIMDAPRFDAREALESHLAALKERKAQIERLIETVENTILQKEGKRAMSDREKFRGFQKMKTEENEEKYGEEIRQKYGEETVRRSYQKFMEMDEAAYQAMQALGDEILRELEQAVRDGVSPTGDMGKKLTEMHRKWLLFTWPEYSPQAHRGLAQMYVSDPRFTEHYDKNVPGCAQFLCDAICAFAER